MNSRSQGLALLQGGVGEAAVGAVKRLKLLIRKPTFGCLEHLTKAKTPLQVI